MVSHRVSPFLVAVFVPLFAHVSCDENGLSSSLNLFTLDLYKQLTTTNKGNVISSPLSVDIVMSLVLIAADGNTANQINQTLHYEGLTLSELQQSYRSVLGNLNKGNGNNSLNIADSVWVQKGIRVDQGFSKSAKEDFLATLEQIDFSKGAEAKKIINSWVNKSTEGLIPSLLDEPLDGSTLAVLVNAIYFKGLWEKKFKKEQTSKQVFYNKLNTLKMEVSMMHQIDKFNYARDEDKKVSLLEMNYEGRNISMIVLLPDEVAGIEKFEEDLEFDYLQSLLASKITQKVNVTIPLFETESAFDLKPPLIQLGIEDVFSSKANLPGFGGSDVYVSKVIQKAKIEVNEEGSKAAAATAAVVHFKMANGGYEKPPVIFRADRPFIYFILDKRSNVIIFMGRVYEF